MSFRVERLVTAQNSVILFVSGTIQGRYVDTLREAVVRETGRVALDLEHVSLVDLNAVKLLGQYEAGDIEIKNCPAYVREWISRKRADGPNSSIETRKRGGLEVGEVSTPGTGCMRAERYVGQVAFFEFARLASKNKENIHVLKVAFYHPRRTCRLCHVVRACFPPERR